MTFATICIIVGVVILGLAIYAGRNDGSGAAVLFLVSFGFIVAGLALFVLLWLIKNAFA